ncbi:MAG: hypothetical protein CML06_17145 [Pseudomonadales bacterium]|nr:hypothetical protein [Pseudomonadales bacterium]
MNTRRQIVGTGLIGLDVIISQKGEVLSSSLGGSAGNVLTILASLGWGAFPISYLGRDCVGDSLIDEFKALNCDIQYLVQSVNHHTPVIYQHQLGALHGPTHRFSFSCPICGTKHKPNFSDDIELLNFIPGLPTSDVLFLDRSTSLAATLAEHYFAKGSLVVFEPSSIGDDYQLFQHILNNCHVLKYSDDRLSDLREFDLSSVNVEIQTMGEKGLKFRGASLTQDWFNLGAYDLPKIADTSGAGDWCTAGLIYSIYSRRDNFKDTLRSYNKVAYALAFGQVLSTLNCLTVGARGLSSKLSATKCTNAAASFSRKRFVNEITPTLSNSNKALGGIYEYFFNESPKHHHRAINTQSLDTLACCS